MKEGVYENVFLRSISYLKSAREAFLHITIAQRLPRHRRLRQAAAPTVPRSLSIRTTSPRSKLCTRTHPSQRPERALDSMRRSSPLPMTGEQALAYHNMGRIYDLMMRKRASEKVLSPSPGS